MSSYEFIVIVGCGRLGSMLANQLSRLGRSIVVVDREEDAFHNLSTEFSGFYVVGDAAEMAVLRRARIAEADCVLAVTKHDNVNLMVAQVAKDVFNVPKVIARVFDPAREEVYRTFNIETICPTKMTAEIFLNALSSQGEVGKT
jgi:trk system potassium uptake protein TrkA